MGDPNASIPTPQPVFSRPMFAGLNSRAASSASLAFVSKRCVESGMGKSYNLQKPLYAVRNTRNIGKKDMVLNNATPKVTVDPQTYRVVANGEWLQSPPASVVPMSQRYFLH